MFEGQKSLSLENIALKQVSDDGEFEGYGSVFNIRDSYDEVIRPGAYENTLAKWATRDRLPMMLWQHDRQQPIGVWTEMFEDEKGLFVKGKLTLGNSKARDCWELLRSQAVYGLSIGFRYVRYEIVNTDADYDGESTVYIDELDLREVSLVSFPANEESEVMDVRHGHPHLGKKDLEMGMRRMGLSAGLTKKILKHGFKDTEPPGVAAKNVEPPGVATAEVIAAMKSLSNSFK